MDDNRKIDDCWNRIGVWSNSEASCPRLVKAIHCRNCEVYSAAGKTMLEREILEDALQHWADHYSQPAKRIKPQGTSFTVFRIGVEWLAIPTRTVKGVVDPGPIRRIPHREHPVLCGMANLSGNLELVVSMAKLLSIEFDANKESLDSCHQYNRSIPRMLRIREKSGSFAFEAAEVSGICRHEEGKLSRVSSTLEKAMHRYVRGTIDLDGRCIGVLDMDLVNFSVEQSLK